VINETAAARYWPRRDPIGTRIRYATGVRDGQWSGWGPWLTIVGVAKDVRFQGPRVAVRPAIYVAHAQQPRAAYRGRTMTLVVRTRDERSDVGAAIRRLARGLHAQATVGEATTLGDVVATAHARPLVMGRMVAAFAAVGVLIAAIGVYGVVAYAVARRTREIGVRMALGATRRNVAWTVAKQTAVLLAAGLTAGAAAMAWMAAPLRAVLFGVEPFDPATGAAVALLLVAVVAAAVAAPVRRAMRVDPLVALRSE
jgi:hypothetical protein